MLPRLATAFFISAGVALLMSKAAVAAPLPMTDTAKISSSGVRDDDVDATWRRMAAEDITGTFAISENCREKPLIEVTPVASVRRDDGVLRVTEKWNLSGCGREKAWQVIFNPDSSTGLSFFLWENRKKYAP